MAIDLVKLAKKIRNERDFPVLPQVMVRVREVSMDKKSSAADLANVILRDQVLTTRVLQIVNSAFYGGGKRKVSTVTQAIVILGFDNVRNITLGVSAQSVISRFANEDSMEAFWLHSLACGVGAQLIAEKLGRRTSEEGFVAGLVHNVGKVILRKYYPAEYQEVENAVEGGQPAFKAEREIFGHDHCDVGHLVSETWHLPSELHDAITHHHHPLVAKNKPTYDAVSMVHISNLLATNLYGIAAERERVPFSMIVDAADRHLSVTPEILEAVIEPISKQVEEYAEFFGFSTTKEKNDESEKADTAMVKTLRDRMASREEQLEAIQAITMSILQGEPLETIFSLIAHSIAETVGLQRVILLTVEGPIIRAVVGYGEDAPELSQKLRLRVSEKAGIIGRTILEKKSFNITDIESDVFRPLLNRKVVKYLHTQAFATLPFPGNQPEAPGLIWIDAGEEGGVVSNQQMEALANFAGQAAMAVEKNRLSS